MSKTKINIRNLSFDELTEKVISIGEKKFRAKQVYEWIWKRGARSFSDMHNVSKKITEALEADYFLDCLTISDEQKSNDGTIKVAFKSFDGLITEGVLIPTENRVTACISSQVGCSLACVFCATGRLKLMRNLSAGEVYDQVLLLTKLSEEMCFLWAKLDKFIPSSHGEKSTETVSQLVKRLQEKSSKSTVCRNLRF